MNTVAIIEVAPQSATQDFINLLLKNNFYAAWAVKGENRIFRLPSSCVWRPSEHEEAKESVDETHENINRLFEEYASQQADPPKLQQLLVLPAKPYASMDMKKEEESPFEKFCKLALLKNPDMTQEALQELYQLAQNV